jgi:sec-independent protein translocase protein TatB
MFDFAWSEFALIGVVALIAIGPKDMPAAIKTITGLIKKARKMAAEFQTHVDEMVREADLGEVRDHMKTLRNFDIRGEIAKHVDGDGTIRNALKDDPFKATPPVWQPVTTPAVTTPAVSTPAVSTSAVSTAAGDVATLERPEVTPESHPTLWEPPAIAPIHAPDPELALAFVPPWVAAEQAERDAAPAFIPPAAAQNVLNGQVF